MAKKKVVKTKTDEEIKNAIKSNKLIIGTRTVFKCLKRGSIETVIYASNCPDSSKEDLNRYVKASNIKISEFKGDSVKLGEFCGKPFNILLIGIKK